MSTPVTNHTPDPIDEYTVVVNYPSDWKEVHNYIINENEIDGIPNRKLECKDVRHYCIKTSVYMMSAEEAAVLKTHPKIEHVELNQDKYPQPQSALELTVKNTGSDPQRYGRNVAFNKPRAAIGGNFTTEQDGFAPVTHTNGVRSNWSHSFINTTDSTPFRGVGITTTETLNSDLSFVLDGREVDVIVMDSGVSLLHPEFIDEAGNSRVRDLYLDGPFAVDPAGFPGSTGTQNYTIDGVTIQRPEENRSKAWWYNTGLRSLPFRYNGSPESVAIIAPPSGYSQYTHVHAHAKTGSAPIIDGHGTAVASQIGGKSFGLAFKCNIWNARIQMSGSGGYFAASTFFNFVTNWHKAKKIASANPNPTIVCCSFASLISATSTFNNFGVTYTHTYRGTTKTYTGTNSFNTNTHPDAGPFLTISGQRYTKPNLQTVDNTSLGAGYLADNSTTSAAAETAISNGVIVVAAAGNENQKLSTSSDVDFDNYMEYPTAVDNYPNRVGGVQKGFSGDHERLKGSIRVGALDCAVEPYCEKQGVTKFSIRKAYYSNNGPMINVYAPADSTMAAAFANYETDSYYKAATREDSSNFKDMYFNGTSSAAPNTVSLISLYLQNNRSASQSDVATWLDNVGSKTISLSDPYQTGNNGDSTDLTNNYWKGDQTSPDFAGDCYNSKGGGNLRGSVSKVLYNPFVNGLAANRPEVKVINATGISFTHP